MRTWNLLGAAALVMMALGAGCGGGAGSAAGPEVTPGLPAATALSYLDPTDPGQWRLVRDSGSSASLLILDLLAPAGSSGRGVTFVLAADPAKVAWQAVDGAALVKNLGFSGSPVRRASPQDGGLRVLLAQTPGTPVSYGAAPLLSVALELGGQVEPGTIALAASQAAHLGAAATAETITIAVGTLQAR